MPIPRGLGTYDNPTKQELNPPVPYQCYIAFSLAMLSPNLLTFPRFATHYKLGNSVSHNFGRFLDFKYVSRCHQTL